MAIFSVSGVNVAGISACVPRKEVFTRNYEKISEAERNMFIKTVGVESRRIAEKGTTTLDLGIKAAEKLIESLNWNRSEIQLLIFVTQSKDYFLPGNATISQEKLKLNKSCMAFDVSLGCSGYVYGLSVISSLMNTTGIKKAILLAGDISTVNCSYEDKSTYPLFGDAATCTAIELKEDAEDWFFNLYSDGSGYDAIMIPDGGIRNLITKETSFESVKIEDGISRAPLHLALKGIDVFNFSISQVPLSIKELLLYMGRDVKSYDYFIFHQANKLMNETIRKKCAIESEKVPYSIDKFGNTSSASVPLTIVTQLGKKVREEKSVFLFSGFGVGLSWGNVSLNLEKIVCPELIEL
jgi:3-oxoacyl-[acyl-carrier-protein] synthase III